VKSPIAILVVAALGLSACADQPVTVAHHRKHVSPPAVEPPVWPADSFNQANAALALNAGAAARKAGKLVDARRATEEALALWPVAIEGWEQLIEICRQQDDEECRRYAGFFHAKLVVLAGLPMRAAALGFETVAANKPGTKVDNTVYDQRMLDMATRLWVFCSKEDPANAKAPEPTEPGFNEAYPYAPALLVIGIGAGLLTGIKSIANK
jgi:hypothetical protein